MSSDDIYRFRSFGPAPPRKPLPGRFRKSRPSEEVVTLARELAKARRETPGSRLAGRLTPTPGNVLIDDKDVLLGEWIDQRVNEGRQPWACSGRARNWKKCVRSSLDFSVRCWT